MVQFIWEFVVRMEKVKEFERHYAVTGPWADLFCKSAGYRGTILLRDTENARRYLTIDRWDTAAAQRAMRERFAAQYDELDRACEGFTKSERRIGVFEE